LLVICGLLCMSSLTATQRTNPHEDTQEVEGDWSSYVAPTGDSMIRMDCDSTNFSFITDQLSDANATVNTSFIGV